MFSFTTTKINILFLDDGELQSTLKFVGYRVNESN